MGTIIRSGAEGVPVSGPANKEQGPGLLRIELPSQAKHCGGCTALRLTGDLRLQRPLSPVEPLAPAAGIPLAAHQVVKLKILDSTRRSPAKGEAVPKLARLGSVGNEK